jgi:hypothetical protein
MSENPCRDIILPEGYNDSLTARFAEMERRKAKRVKTIAQYPIRVRQVKRLRKQIMQLNRALTREKRWSEKVWGLYQNLRPLEQFKQDMPFQILNGVILGALAGFLLAVYVFDIL